jgi:hypothetical protein
LTSHAVVMLTDDGKSFVALSTIVAMFCVPPEFTVTVNDGDLTAVRVTVPVLDASPACAETFAVTIVSAVTTAGRARSRIIQVVPEKGEGRTRGALATVPRVTTELILSASLARLTNDPRRRHPQRLVRNLDTTRSTGERRRVDCQLARSDHSRGGALPDGI